ncbi:MAG: tyrosine-type recombinase/integrase [Kiritimatiellae bacterium]|jgi:site-specific recombinase XerD|nr:tyrosine-type recombinase/integrase [Kiritimatiellia bacterium]
MLEAFFLKRWWIAGVRGGQLGRHIDAFCADLVAERYTRITIRNAISAAVRFDHWLDSRKLGACDVSEEVIARFRGRRGRRKNRNGESLLHKLLLRLRLDGVAPEPVAQTSRTPLERVVEDFCDYLRRERGLSPNTIVGYAHVAGSFVSQRFGTGPVDLTALDARDVRAFVLRQAQGRTSDFLRVKVNALRWFLRFLYLHGDVSSQLAGHVPPPPVWHHDGPPKWLGSDDIARVLDRCDRQSATGKRDFAILMLLARLGLRSGEVVALKLDDIRWDTGDIVVCGKARERKRFPLLQDVGEAIAAYLRYGRPPSSSRNVFLRAKAPYRELAGSSSVYRVAADALARAGLTPPRRGAHLFRHSLATNLMRNGATLGEIGQILHHRDPNTTAIYAKADIAGLRAVALPWPGEGS